MRWRTMLHLSRSLARSLSLSGPTRALCLEIVGFGSRPEVVVALPSEQQITSVAPSARRLRVHVPVHPRQPGGALRRALGTRNM
eukprot:516278-Rhodomonas_salina.1